MGKDNIPQCLHHLLSKEHILNLKHVISWEFYNLSGINTSYFCWEVIEADISLKSQRFHLEILSDCIKLPFLRLRSVDYSPLITSLSESPFVVLCRFTLDSVLFLLISILEEIILMEAWPNVPKMAFPKNWDLIALARF